MAVAEVLMVRVRRSRKLHSHVKQLHGAEGGGAARSSYPYHHIFTPHLSIVSTSVLIETDISNDTDVIIMAVPILRTYSYET